MGLMGLVAGASTAGVMGVVRLMGDTWLPRLAASSEQKHQMMSNLHPRTLSPTAPWPVPGTALDVNCDNPTVALLSLEIGRIEREWVNDARSYPRRARN